MSTLKINVGELRNVLKEESEFKAVVFGDKETKQINDKAYSDIKKETEKYDGGLTSSKKDADGIGKGIGNNDNLGMSDLRYDNISKPFIDRTKSQMKGYVSKDAEDKHKDDAFGNATFDKEGDFYKSAKEHAEDAKQGRDTAAEIGLTARELKKTDIEKQDKTMFEGKNNKIKMLSFKNTRFISEGHMMTKIPDEYKKDGSKFIMRDSAKNEYLVEWTSSEPKVTKKLNLDMVNEEKQRIKELWGYKSQEAHKSTSSFRLQEDKGFSDMVNKARKLMKD